MTRSTTDPEASIIIVTRNRCEMALTALESALQQHGNHEVLAVVDGTDDDTAEQVRSRYPEVIVLEYPERAGLVVRRNDAAGVARGRVFVSIDDDAVFTHVDVVSNVLLDFSHDRVGAVAIPHQDRGGENPGGLDPAPAGDAVFVVPAFRGCAYAVRADVFTFLKGFRAELVHQGEERDFAARLLAEGWVVRVGRHGNVDHFVSTAARDYRRMDLYGRRNDTLYAFTYFPFGRALVLFYVYALRGLLIGFRSKRLSNMVRGLALGLRAAWMYRDQRRVLPAAAIKALRRIQREAPVDLRAVEPFLPPLNRAFATNTVGQSASDGS